MRRVSAVLAALVVVLAGCGESDGGGAASPTTVAAPGISAAPSGPAAPDFELALAGGGTFSPAAEEKPVYLVFWAEW